MKKAFCTLGSPQAQRHHSHGPFLGFRREKVKYEKKKKRSRVSLKKKKKKKARELPRGKSLPFKFKKTESIQ